MLFLDVKPAYQHGLLSGLRERWEEDKRDIDWDRVLHFIDLLVHQETFQNELSIETADSWEPSTHWVISDISDLIKAGATKERVLPSTQLMGSARILRKVLNEIRPTRASEVKDAVSHALNSSRGRALGALIHVAIALRRQELSAGSSAHVSTWSCVGPVFEDALLLSERGEDGDFAGLAGLYLQNLHYINAEWVEQNFDRLFSTGNDQAWKCTAHGFSYQSYLYDWLYAKIKSGGHLRRMVLTVDLPETVAERALQFLGLAFLTRKEELVGNSLLVELIDDLHVDKLTHLCWFFSTRGGGDSAPETGARVLEFWDRVAAVIRQKGKTNIELQSALGLLPPYINEITPQIEQIWSEAAPYAAAHYHGDVLVEELARLAEVSPGPVVRILRAALRNFLPDYPMEKIVDLILTLARVGYMEDAEWICNEYASRGSSLLKDTYENLRMSQRTRKDHETERKNP
jgi:hypothetical protein